MIGIRTNLQGGKAISAVGSTAEKGRATQRHGSLPVADQVSGERRPRQSGGQALQTFPHWLGFSARSWRRAIATCMPPTPATPRFSPTGLATGCRRMSRRSMARSSACTGSFRINATGATMWPTPRSWSIRRPATRASVMPLGLHCLAEARRAGFLAMQFNMVVSTNTRAVGLWKRLGFAIVGTLPKAFRHQRLGLVDAYVMYRFL